MIEIIKNKKLFFFGIAIITFFAWLDLYSKEQIFIILDEFSVTENTAYPEIKITSFFSLVKVWNKGVSFGMLNDLENGKYLISIVNIIISGILLIWLYRNHSIYLMWAISLIIGGAMGNLFDRFKNDAVADFLDFYISSYHWPAFNLADSIVFIGVALLLLENFFVKKDEK
jgi:signal peptidase II